MNDLLNEKYEERDVLLKQIYLVKNDIIELYKDAYLPVTKLIKSSSDIMADYKIEFDASLKLNNFESRFFNFINQGSKGSFSGKEEGYKRLINIIDESEFSDFESCKVFIDEILDRLKKDFRDGKKMESRYLSEQLRKGIEPTEFYDYFFGLDYLDATYQLKLGSKGLSELSPGERGALLLIFYLLLDKGDTPLIIDQP
ncbi:MAG: ABC transporter, partial [Chloroflexia bacterium]|nr:ABC transporter [Chloroflexia bacterium]